MSEQDNFAFKSVVFIALAWLAGWLIVRSAIFLLRGALPAWYEVLAAVVFGAVVGLMMERIKRAQRKAERKFRRQRGRE